MNILGISALDKESTATVVRDGRIIAAVSEERLTRVKQQGGFPGQAVDMVLDMAGLAPRDVDTVAYPFFRVATELRLAARSALHDARSWREKISRRGAAPIARHYASLAKTLTWGIGRKLAASDRQLHQGLSSLGLVRRLRRFDHQLTHAITAYYSSGFDRALVVTSDWYGSGKAGAVYLGDGGTLRLIAAVPFPNSVGVLYSGVTAALGFVPDRHEGKIVGLAAYGDPSRLTGAVMQRFVEREDGYDFLDAMNARTVLDLIAGHAREDVAAAHQRALENVLLKTLDYYLRQTGCRRLAVAGGVFANVKLNQKIVGLEDVEELFVYPAMSDMGTGTGAALAAALEAGDISGPAPIDTVFLGPEYSDGQIEAALAESGLSASRELQLPMRVAELIADGRVVGRFTGRMEYGPRALGHRSILAGTANTNITEILNQKLHRNDFMPFAPATLDEAAAACYVGAEKVRHTAQFMTVCLPCTPSMQQMSPGAVHIDGTARPQFVTSAFNPDLYEILVHVRRLTGVPSVINTSFNVHEDPIVCSPKDAIETFLAAGLDALAIGDYLVLR